MRATVALSSCVLTVLLAGAVPVGAQVDDPLHGGGGLKWVVADGVGYGGLGFGLGVLVAQVVEGSGRGPVQPTAAAQLSGGSSTSRYALGNLDLVYAPDATTLAIVAAATKAGAVTGTMIGLDARRIAAAGGRVEGIHRAAVQKVAFLVGSGALAGALFALRYRRELGSKSISVTPSSVGRGATVHVRVILREGPIEWSLRRFDFDDEGGRRSPVGAAILGAYVPLAGYAYAGRWKGGIAPQALWLTFAGGMAFASDCDVDRGCSSAQETVGALAWAAGVASVFWGGVGAYRTARADNHAIEERLQIAARSGPDGSVSVAVRVPFR